MTPANVRSAIVEEAPSHPEEIRSEFDLHVGKHIHLQGKARITPAGIICCGLAAAMLGFAFGFAARSVQRRR